MKDWLLVSGLNKRVIQKINKSSRHWGCVFFLPFAIAYLVMGLFFIPFGIIDLIFLVANRWVWWVFGRGKRNYIHTASSVIILVLLLLILTGSSFLVKQAIDLGSLDWKMNFVFTAVLWLGFSAIIVQIIVRRSSQYHDIKLLTFVKNRFGARIASIDVQLAEIQKIKAYTPSFIKRVDDNLNSLLSERQTLQAEQEAVEKTIEEVNRSKIRINFW
jgi:hypothetical protein